MEHQLLGETIFICDKAQANQIWNDRPHDRHRIWMQGEAFACTPLSEAELRAIMAKKAAQPGYVYKRGSNVNRN